MARTKTNPGTRPSAAHAAADPAPAPVTGPAAGSAAAAVHAALTANPAATVAAIAGAAGTGTPAARDALLAMEKGGTATRVKGGKPGIPDTWTLAVPAQHDAGPAGDGPDDEPAAQPGHSTAASPDSPRDDETAAADGPSGVPGAATETPGPHDAPAGDAHQDAVPDEQAAQATPGSDPGGAGAPHGADTPADAGGEPGGELDQALAADLTGHLGQIRGAADAAGLALTASRDLTTALASLEQICEHAAQARRALKAAIGGRKAPAARPGGLRDKVLAHLGEHPDKEFTPHDLHKVLGHSSGAIANALETLVKLGQAEVAAEKPRRFRRAAQPAEPAPGEGGPEQDSAELAGAA